MIFSLLSESDTLNLGAALGRQLKGLVDKSRGAAQIHLQGGLGAGKTTMVRGLLRSLGVTGPVKSPTYTLVEPYHEAGLSIYHFDLYRIGDPGELEFLGFADYCHPGAVCCLEWPQRGQGCLPPADLVIRLEAGREAHTAAVEPVSSLGEALCSGIDRGNFSVQRASREVNADQEKSH